MNCACLASAPLLWFALILTFHVYSCALLVCIHCLADALLIPYTSFFFDNRSCLGFFLVSFLLHSSMIAKNLSLSLSSQCCNYAPDKRVQDTLFSISLSSFFFCFMVGSCKNNIAYWSVVSIFGRTLCISMGKGEAQQGEIYIYIPRLMRWWWKRWRKKNTHNSH